MDHEQGEKGATMARITVVGGTGYAGSAIAKEAASRGHEVTVLSRKAPEAPLDGVTYVQGDAGDKATQQEVVTGRDAVVSALSPRAGSQGTMSASVLGLGGVAASSGARLVVVGGFGSMRPAPGAPRLAEGDGLPEAYRAEAQEMAGVVDALPGTLAELDWVFVSPAPNFGAFNPGERTGRYVVGNDVADFGEEHATISGADYAVGIVDEIERPAHHRVHISLTY